jgi:competence protein ComEC
MFSACDSFFRKAPALLYGLALYLGFSLGLGQTEPLVFAAPLFVLAQKRRLALILLILAAAGFAQVYYQFPKKDSTDGTAHITISSLKPYNGNFSQGVIYSGSVKWMFQSGEVVAKNIPVTLKSSHRHPADSDYLVRGTLKKNQFGSYSFFPKKGQKWEPVAGTWSLAGWRYRLKMNLKTMIESRFSQKKAAAFLSGIATGIFDDTAMVHEFSRFGLQHIMAISGFHFALAALFLSMTLKFLLREKTAAKAVVLLLTSYFMFLGTSPSIFRAWIMATIYFAGILIDKQSRPLNSLGIAAIIILLADPLCCRHLGFQFSFLVTASILAFHQPMDSLLQQFFRKRPQAELLAMDRLNQHGYILSCLLRQSLALMLAVQVSAAPLILFTMHKFPLMSLVYNLFFPFLVSLSVFLLILGLLTGLPPIHNLNGAYTEFVLNLVYRLPSNFDYWVRIDVFSPFLLAAYFSFLLIAAILARQRLEENRQEKRDFAYL